VCLPANMLQAAHLPSWPVRTHIHLHQVTLQQRRQHSCCVMSQCMTQIRPQVQRGSCTHRAVCCCSAWTPSGLATLNATGWGSCAPCPPSPGHLVRGTTRVTDQQACSRSQCVGVSRGGAEQGHRPHLQSHVPSPDVADPGQRPAPAAPQPVCGPALAGSWRHLPTTIMPANMTWLCCQVSASPEC